MILGYIIVAIFVLYICVQFYTQREPFADISAASGDVVRQAVLASQAATAASSAVAAAESQNVIAAAQSNDVRVLGSGRDTAAVMQTMWSADKELRKSEQLVRLADIEKARVDQKRAVEQTKMARAAVKALTVQELTAIRALSRDEQQAQLAVAESQQALIQDKIQVKRAEIDTLRTELASIDVLVDTVDPPGLGKRLGRFFR